MSASHETASFSEPIPRGLLRPAIEMIVRGDYGGAEREAAAAGRADKLAGLFLSASILHAKMGELESTAEEASFTAAADLVYTAAENLLRENPDSVPALFYRGTVKTYEAVLRSRQGKYFSAFMIARDGIGDLERCRAKQRPFPEADIAVELFRYWRSAKNFLRFLPGVSDNRESAIAAVHGALSPESISSALGMNQLFWVLLDYGRYDDAERIVLQGLKQYPGSRFFLYPAGVLFQRTGRAGDAAKYYRRSADSLARDGFGNRYMYLKGRVKQAECLIGLAEYETAAAVLTEALERDIFPEERGKCEPLLSTAADLRRTALQRAEERKNR